MPGSPNAIISLHAGLGRDVAREQRTRPVSVTRESAARRRGCTSRSSSEVAGRRAPTSKVAAARVPMSITRSQARDGKARRKDTSAATRVAAPQRESPFCDCDGVRLWRVCVLWILGPGGRGLKAHVKPPQRTPQPDPVGSRPLPAAPLALLRRRGRLLRPTPALWRLQVRC